MGVAVWSSRLQFTRDGKVLAVAEADAVTIASVRGDRRERHAIAGAQSIAAFGDQVWVATGEGEVVRLGLDGRVSRQATLVSPDPDAALVASVVGPPAAQWTAREPVLLVDDLGTIVQHELTGSLAAEVVIFAGGRRAVRCNGPRIALPSGALCALANGARIVGGTVLFDGNAVLLVADGASGRDGVVLQLASGRALQTVALPAGMLRVAARRGVAAILEAPRRLALVDLRFARRMGSIALDADATDLAIDPDGELLAVQGASGAIDLIAIKERLVTGASAPIAPPAEAIAAPAPPPPPAPEPKRPASDFRPTVSWDIDERDAVAPRVAPELLAALGTRPIPTIAEPRSLAALEPRSSVPPVSRAVALAQLEAEVRTVTLWALRAIAEGWDTHRLGYGNEGVHPFEHEVAAIVGENAGFARDYLAAADQRIADHERALAADPQHRAAGTPLAELAAEFGLSRAAIAVLLVVAAPALHGEIARLYGILANDAGRPIVDELLVQQVLAARVNRHDVAAELHPSAPLVRLGILEAAAGRARPFGALALDPVVLARLRGERPELGATPTIRASDRALDQLELAPGVLAKALAAIGSAATPARIAVRGRTGSGRRALLAALAIDAGRALGIVDAALLPRDADRFPLALRAALRRAQLAGLLPVVANLEAVVLDERGGSDLAFETLRAHPGPLAVISPLTTTPPFPPGHALIDLPVLSETERLAVWQRALAPTTLWLRDAPGLAARYRVGPGVIHRAIAAARTAAAAADATPGAPSDDAIDAFLRQARDARLADHARRVERLASWADLVLPPDIMDSLRELVARVRHRRTVFEDWGMSRAMATSRGLTALFQGQPGTGKTLVAGVIARELGLDLYQVDLSKVMSKWIGETERNLSTIFDAAEDGQVILLFDEADSLFAKRTEIRSSNDRYANLEVNYLLQRLDSFEGIAVLTTNSGGSIDPAFKRRLSFRLSFPFPDEETRAQLWRAHLPAELPRDGELVFDDLARKYQISGGYIRNACLRAAFLAAQDESGLAQRHLDRAVALEFAELGKLSTGGTLD